MSESVADVPKLAPLWETRRKSSTHAKHVEVVGLPTGAAQRQIDLPTGAEHGQRIDRHGAGPARVQLG